MTIEKFYEALLFASNLDKNLDLQRSLEAIRDNLNNLVATPASPQHQASLATAMESFSRAALSMREKCTPAALASIAEMGGAEFFEPKIAERVRAWIAENAMTPSVARDFVADLATRRAKFLGVVRSTIDGLQGLGVRTEGVRSGVADASFMIPRSLFQNQIGPLAKELTFIGRLIAHCGEAITGEAAAAELEALSSSVPTVAVIAAIGAIRFIAESVNKFLEAWERIERIRKIRSELNEMGIKGAPLAVLNKQVAETVRAVVENSVQTALANYGKDEARRNELETALTQDMRRLFGQIERGLTIQFRAEADPNASGSDKAALEAINQASHSLQFPEVEEKPLLLTDGNVLEGEIADPVEDEDEPQSPAEKRPARKIKPDQKEN